MEPTQPASPVWKEITSSASWAQPEDFWDTIVRTSSPFHYLRAFLTRPKPALFFGSDVFRSCRIVFLPFYAIFRT
jgi:hypothetical protein